jgi:hypothetical protein
MNAVARILIVLFACLFNGSPLFAQEVVALKKPGVLPSPTNECLAKLEISGKGGYLRLSIARHGSDFRNPDAIDDVTGISWVDGIQLVFSVSPIYGKPGIYLANCIENNSKPVRLAAPQTIDKAYPNGADYYELKSVSGRDVFFYYGRDVDEIDFKNFRSKKFIQTLKLPTIEHKK